MKYVIIPDVHGRDFWKPVYKEMNPEKCPDTIWVFLGDYLDPYPKEGIRNEDALRDFNVIMNIRRVFPRNTILLLGNHDLGYLFGKSYCTSRHWHEMHEEIHKLFSDNLNKFNLFYETEDGTLITHAGVHTKWLSHYDMSLEDFMKYNDLLHGETSKERSHAIYTLADVDRYRSGWCSAGSPVWADVRSYIEDNGYLLDKKQIIGHTQLVENPIKIGNIYCVDCRRAFLLEDGVLKEIDGSPLKYAEVP